MHKVIRKLNRAIESYIYFAENGWNWEVNNTNRLYEQLTEEDKVTFNFDFSKFSWKTYLHAWYDGCKEFSKRNEPPKKTNSSSSSSLQIILFTSILLVILLAVLFTFLEDVIFDSSLNTTNQTNPTPSFSFVNLLNQLVFQQTISASTSDDLKQN